MTNKTDKKLTAKRIMIYLILAFVPVYIICIFGTDKDSNFKTNFGSLSIMWYPAIANILTRLLTREGFEDSKLRINMKGSGRYYILSAALPILLAVAGGIAELLRHLDGYSFSRGVKQLDGGKGIAASLMLCAVASIVQLDRGFGEEFGWRAYLTPKMEELMPSPLAITVSGIIWGLWHAPLIAKGYNFGKEVHPAVAVVSMCIACVVLSFILTWLTKKTGSVWPAAIFHIVYDAFNVMILTVLCAGAKDFEEMTLSYSSAVIFMCIIPLAAAIPAAVSMMKNDKAA